MRLTLEHLEPRLALSGFVTSAAPYLLSTAAGVSVAPLLTAGDAVGAYRLTGVPDGLGIIANSDGTVTLLMNHEFGPTVASAPVVGGPEHLGADVGRWTLSPADPGVGVLSGGPGYTTVVRGTDPTPLAGAFANFCAASLAGPAQGFDRPMFLTGEEGSGAGTFDGQGGSAVAIFDGVAHLLPEFGHFRHENLAVLPGTGAKTVVIASEDAGAFDSQLYLYVGTKNPAATNPLVKNGLVGGTLYVLAATGAKRDENAFAKSDGTLTALTWAAIPDPTVNDVALEATVQALNSFNFARVEDAAADPTQPGVVYFTSTGNVAATGNVKGRVNRLALDLTQTPTGPTSLRVLLAGDAGDPVLNPDNLDVNAAGQLVICEDVNADQRPSLNNRDASVWLFDTTTTALTRVAEIDRTGGGTIPPAARGTPGTWETSGVVDASAAYGPGSWLIDVQAHTIDSLTASQLAGSSVDLKLVQGGQLLLLKTGHVAASGRVFRDVNANALRSANEVGVAGATVYVDANNNGQRDAGETAALSDAAGNYQLAGPLAGFVALRVEPPLGTQGTTPGNARSFVIVGTAAAVGQDFGVVPTFSVLPAPAFADLYGPHPNADQNAAFVKGLFRATLARDAEPTAVAYWSAQLASGTTQSAVVSQVWNSAEHRGGQVDAYYRAYLQRDADPSGRAYFVGLLQAGTGEAAVVTSFLASAEYGQRHGDAAGYIAGLYLDLLARPSAPSETAYWLGELNAGQTRAGVAARFLASAEAASRAASALYSAYLHRAAASAELADAVARLAGGQVTFSRFARGFLASPEFWANAVVP